MLEAIPIDYYSDIYFHLLLAINFFTLFHCYVLDIDNVKNIIYIKVMGILIFAFTAVYLGFRPIHRIFVDMGAYAQYFSHYMHGGDLLKKKDMTFQYFMKFLSNFMGYKGFFFTCLIIYVLPMFIISKRLFKKYWFYSFLMLISSFSFWAYGVNGIRNGIATSLFLLALAYRNNKMSLVLLLFLSCGFHKTMLLPTIAYILTLFINNPKLYLRFWLLTIPLSLILGSVWVALFTSLGFGDDRLSGYMNSAQNTSFRFDFLIYSAIPIVVGWYFIFKRGFNDKVYHQLFNIYLICNGFWVLVIRANFSNRFAYLSWFMMAINVAYPYLKQTFYKNQNIAIGRVIIAYFSFTYIMFLIYKYFI